MKIPTIIKWLWFRTFTRMINSNPPESFKVYSSQFVHNSIPFSESRHSKTMLYNFPGIKTPPDHSAYQQALRVIDEADEMMAELNDDPPSELFNLESMDLYHALETYFRMMKPERVDELKEKTINKNRERGYYE